MSCSSSPNPAPAHVQDHRVFLETLSDSLHERNEKRIGKVITDERFDRLVRACGLPINDPSVTISEREAIAHNKYVAGVDGRLGNPGMKTMILPLALGPLVCMKWPDSQIFYV